MLDIGDAIDVAAAGYYKTCVLRADRSMWCMGYNRKAARRRHHDQPVAPHARDRVEQRAPHGEGAVRLPYDGDDHEQ